MILTFPDGKKIDTSKGIDCSIPLSASNQNPRAWYVDAPEISPVKANGWIGSVSEGGGVNFRNIAFNPHGHGTHTECLGHITEEVHSVNGLIKDLFYFAEVITITPEFVLNLDGSMDQIITLDQVKKAVKSIEIDALLIRTLPNELSKLSMNYSDKNPAYLQVGIVPFLNELGVKHLLVDVPSVDREKDNGLLEFHHAFWGVPEAPDFSRTITEMIFIPNEVNDGVYYLNLQTAPFVNDATPSRPVIFQVF